MAGMDIECKFRCPKCGDVPFILYRRETRPNGPWQNVLWPTKQGVMPPADSHHIACPSCGVDCERVSP